MRVAGEAVHASVAAAAVRVDRPPERHPRSFRNLADQATGLYLMEGDAAEARCVERPGHDGVPAEQRRLSLSDPERVPAHEREHRTAFRSDQMCFRVDGQTRTL